MVRAGLVLGPEINKPEKRAQPAFLSRDAVGRRG